VTAPSASFVGAARPRRILRRPCALAAARRPARLDVVWETVTEDLPPLIERLDAIVPPWRGG
jgi:hypothetical protein